MPVGRWRGHVASNTAGFTEPRAAPGSLPARKQGPKTYNLKEQDPASNLSGFGKDPDFQERTKPADISIPSL